MKWSATVDLTLSIDYSDIEAETEEEAKQIAIDMAYEDVDFNNCYCNDTADAFVWEDEVADSE